MNQVRLTISAIDYESRTVTFARAICGATGEARKPHWLDALDDLRVQPPDEHVQEDDQIWVSQETYADIYANGNKWSVAPKQEAA